MPEETETAALTLPLDYVTDLLEVASRADETHPAVLRVRGEVAKFQEANHDTPEEPGPLES